MSVIDFAVLSFASLFVIVDPIALVPSFLAMTPQTSAADRIRISALASGITAVILLVFAFFGEGIFSIFGITLPAFEIAGGIILLLISLDMLRARRTTMKETPEEQAEGTGRDDVAISPLAVPMLAGPGAISATILLAARAETLALRSILVGNILLVSFLTFVILKVAAERSNALSVIALKVTARLMGLLLASISVQFIVNGVKGLGLPL